MNPEVIADPHGREIAAAWTGPIRRFAKRFPLASDKLFAVVDQMIVSATSFATAVIIGRTTSPDDLGAYYLTLSIVFLALGLQYQMIVAPYSVFAHHRRGRELREYAGSTWVHQFLFTGIVALSLYLAVPISWLFGWHEVFSGATALAIALPLLLLREAIRRFSYAHLKLATPVAIDITVAVVQLSSLAVLGYLGLLSLWTIYAAMATACALAAAAWYVVDHPPLRFIRQRFLTDWCHNWAFSRWAVPTFLLTNLTDYALLWIVGIVSGVAVAGTLGACVTLVGLSNVFVTGVSNVLTVQAAKAFADGGRKELVRVLTGAATLMAGALGSLCLLVTLAGDWLPVFVYGDQYLDCGTMVILLAFARLSGSLGVVAANGLWAIAQPRLNFLADICSVLTTALAVTFLVYPFGAQGAATALLIGAFIDATVRWLTLARALRAIASLSSAFPTIRNTPLVPDHSVNLKPTT